MRTRLLSAVVLFSWGVGFAACNGDDTSSPTGTADAGQDGTTTPTMDGAVTTTPPDDAGPPDDGSAALDAPGTDSNAPADSGTDGDADGGVSRGPTTLNFDPAGMGSPSSLWWDDAKQILFITDNLNNQIWTYTDAAGFKKLAQLPDDPGADDAGDTQLDQIVELADGTLVVTRFGFAKYGAILYLRPDGGTGIVPNVDPTRRRIGLTVDSTGQIWSNSFIKPATGPMQGSVEKVDLANGTTTFATGLQKPVGMAVVNGQLLVSDQNQNVIFALPTAAAGIGDGGLSDGGSYPIYASMPIPDLLAIGPNGTVFTGQFKSTIDGGVPQIRQVLADGGVDIFEPDASFSVIDDTAYDPTNKRLFVIDSNGSVVRTIKIFPVD